jgi:hypothetical protein
VRKRDFFNSPTDYEFLSEIRDLTVTYIHDPGKVVGTILEFRKADASPTLRMTPKTIVSTGPGVCYLCVSVPLATLHSEKLTPLISRALVCLYA